MNILIVTPYIPYPLSEGGKISQYAEIDILKRTHLITLVLTANNKSDLEYIQALKNQWNDVEIVSINLIPEGNKFMPLERMMRNILRYTLAIERRIIKFIKILFSIRNTNKEDTVYNEFNQPNLTKLPDIKSRNFIEQLNRIIEKKKYDIIQVEHFDYMELVHLFPKDIKKIFVHHEIRFARLGSFAAISDNKPFGYEKYILSAIKSSELNNLKFYDAIFVFSESDKQKLLIELPDSKIFVAPFPVLDSHFKEITKENVKINKLVFTGGEMHSPNKDAVQWYINEIAPLVQAKHNLCLHVTGIWSKEFIEKHNKNKSVYFAGYVEDIISYCKNSIMVVPVRIGSGIRTKILYSMAQGVPVVSTTIGCEGIVVSGNDCILIADDPLKFAESIDQIIKNPDLTYQMLVNSQKIISDSYSQTVIGEVRNKFFSQLVSKTSLNMNA